MEDEATLILGRDVQEDAGRAGSEGDVADVTVVRSVPWLDEAAVEAVRQWRYTRTLVDGVAVPVIMTVTVNFQLR